MAFSFAVMAFSSAFSVTVNDDDMLKAVFTFVGYVLCTPVAIVYVAARLTLITLSFTSLKSLPFGAYQTVQWTTFVPHI